MAFRTLFLLAAIAIFVQRATTEPVRFRGRYGDGGSNAEENEVLKNERPQPEETNYVNEFFTSPLDETEYDTQNIEVPDFTGRNIGRFIHDFNSNKTAIVDVETQRCFVMDMDREQYMPPTSLLDLFWKLQEAHYTVDTDVVRLNMRVVLPAIMDVQSISDIIFRNCVDFNTYMLEETQESTIYKRSIRSATKIFRELSGRRTLEFDIINMEEVLEYETNV